MVVLFKECDGFCMVFHAGHDVPRNASAGFRLQMTDSAGQKTEKRGADADIKTPFWPVIAKARSLTACHRDHGDCAIVNQLPSAGKIGGGFIRRQLIRCNRPARRDGAGERRRNVCMPVQGCQIGQVQPV